MSISDTLKQIECMAIRLLTRREHSRQELQQKLLAKRFSLSDINSVLDALIDSGYQDDHRFAEMYFRTRVLAGDGPLKLRLKLQEKGISSFIINELCSEADIDWYQQATLLKHKRFGEHRAESIKDKAKQIRYLQSRGYHQEHIGAVVE